MAKTDAMGRDTAYEYDASGNKTSRIDPKGPTEWEYEAMNREMGKSTTIACLINRQATSSNSRKSYSTPSFILSVS